MIPQLVSILMAIPGFPPGVPGEGQAVPPPNLKKDVAIEQRLDEQVPLDLAFADETGKSVKLGDYFCGKPVVLILHYTRCPMLCSLVLKGITDGMSKVQQFTIGNDFNVVAVSFDPKETPAVAARTRETYVEQYNMHHAPPAVAEGWHFLTGKQDAIEKLTQAVGFRYTYDAKTDMYAHAAGIIVLTPAGKTSRYLLGIDYNPRDLRLALVEASANKIGSVTDQVLLYCFHYDPSSGKYTANVLGFVRAGGVVTMVAIAGFVWVVVRKRRGASKRALAEAAAARGQAHFSAPTGPKNEPVPGPQPPGPPSEHFPRD